LDKNGQPVLDLVLLGLGEDGHTASLFPGESDEVASSPAVYRAIFNSPKPPPERVTLGYGAIAAAQQVWMLASGGAAKEKAFRESLIADGRTPFGRVLRDRNETRIFSDIVAIQAFSNGGKPPA
jgi:6-phosphogluconolactonase